MQSENEVLNLPVHSSSGPSHRTRETIFYLCFAVIATYALRFESGGCKAENGSGFPSRPWKDMSSGKVRLSPKQGTDYIKATVRRSGVLTAEAKVVLSP